MNYYKFFPDEENSKPDEMVCYAEAEYEKKYGIQGDIFYQGKPIENWNENFTFYYDPTEGDRPTDYLANNLGWLLISSNFQDMLNELGQKHVQFLPVRIINKYNNKKVDGFSVANITKFVDAFSKEHSKWDEFEYRGKKHLFVEKYALKKRSLKKDVHIFRLRQEPLPIFVSEVIKREIQNRNLTGCDFLEVKVV